MQCIRQCSILFVTIFFSFRFCIYYIFSLYLNHTHSDLYLSVSRTLLFIIGAFWIGFMSERLTISYLVISNGNNEAATFQLNIQEGVGHSLSPWFNTLTLKWYGGTEHGFVGILSIPTIEFVRNMHLRIYQNHRNLRKLLNHRKYFLVISLPCVLMQLLVIMINIRMFPLLLSIVCTCLIGVLTFKLSKIFSKNVQ